MVSAANVYTQDSPIVLKSTRLQSDTSATVRIISICLVALVALAVIVGILSAIYLLYRWYTQPKLIDRTQPTEATTLLRNKNGGSQGVVQGHKNESKTLANLQNAQAEENAYDDVVFNENPISSQTNSDDDRTVNAEGLIYQEVGHFKSHPKDAPPIQTEASTDYASLDFNLMKSKTK